MSRQTQDVVARRAVARVLAAFAAYAFAAFASVPTATAVELRFTTENDLLAESTDRDDLYSFAAAVDLERGASTYSLREHGFTDRDAGLRFDETHLSVGRAHGRGPWTFYGEIGAVHVGHGLLGEAAQNAVHRLIGDEEVDLRYLESSWHGRAAATVDRLLQVTDALELGPRFEAELTPGLRSHLVTALGLRWQPTSALAVHAVAGGHWTQASLAALEPHLEDFAPIARLGVVVGERLFASWSYNQYGDERRHFSIGVRVGGRSNPGGAR